MQIIMQSHRAPKIMTAFHTPSPPSLLLSLIFTSILSCDVFAHFLQAPHAVYEAPQASALTHCSNSGRFSAMFGFGTSLSDSGNAVLSNPLFFPVTRPPYGSTFFDRPTGRFSDGRNMIDFVADAIGVPFLNPYLSKKVKGTDFSRGVNYAVAGATAQTSREISMQAEIIFITTSSLDVQVQWHLSIKQAAQQASSSAPLMPDVLLPGPASFSEALYFMEFGVNDYGTAFLSRHLLPIQKNQPINNSYILDKVVSVVVNKMVDAIEVLYANEARNFLVLNVFPEGCAPLYLKLLVGKKDSLGCLEAFNQVNVAHNRQLLSALERLSLKYRDIHLMYADVAEAYTSLLQDPSKYGFKESIKTCCGAGPQTPYQFSLSKICGPSSFKCEDPSRYVVWDGIHNTDALNNFVISTITSSQNLICLRSQ